MQRQGAVALEAAQIHELVDRRRHAGHRTFDIPNATEHSGGGNRIAPRREPVQEPRVPRDAGQRVLEIVRDRTEKLVSDRGLLVGVFRRGSLLALPFIRLQLEGDQVGQDLQECDGAFRQRGGLRIEGAEDAKMLPVATNQGNGDVALDPVELPGGVVCEARVFTRLRDDERRDRAADIISERAR